MCILKLPSNPPPVSDESKPFATLTKEMSINNRKALEHFTAAIALDQSYLKPVYQRMTLLKANEDYEEAIKDAKKVQELDPHFHQINKEI